MCRFIRLLIAFSQGNSASIKAHAGSVRSVSFSSEGKQLVSASDDKAVKVWNVASIKFEYSFVGHNNWVRSAKFSPDARLVVSGGDDKTVKLWDSRKRAAITTFYDHSG